LRLKRVEMIGFKSFMDRTALDFRDGITTVLGPNGCGKSNIVDAVRWVLGEQSAKQLRGEKMEDVIFKGTRKRKPMSMAEVTLVFDNSDQRLAVPYDEVAVTRRVSRAGTSDYFLNRTQCRLKDIRDLFYDTGVGNNAYSVIEQEVVGQVLDPSENKVRLMLEEGSGIVRYKVKRKEALRKLDLTERDLLRVEDIVEEIGKQVRSLARQVGKARRHQRFFAEVKALELIRAHEKIKEMAARVGELRVRDEQLRTDGSGDDATAGRLNAQVSAASARRPSARLRIASICSSVSSVCCARKSSRGGAGRSRLQKSPGAVGIGVRRSNPISAVRRKNERTSVMSCGNARRWWPGARRSRAISTSASRLPVGSSATSSNSPSVSCVRRPIRSR
jgi:chromosome segregation protein